MGFYGYDSLGLGPYWLPLLGFKVWMLLDAMQRGGSRGGSNYWFLICWVPFGDWIYFFAVKVHDPEFAKLRRRFFTRPVPLSQLRYNARHSPSGVNKLRLAEALFDAREYTEAEALLAEVLQLDAKNREARYLLGECKRQRGDLVGSGEELEKVVESDITYRNYHAAADLARVYWATGRREEAVEFLRKLFKKSRRMLHTTELAKYLIELDQKAEAREVLERAIDDFEHAPRFVRRQDRSAAKEAQSLLRSL